MRVSNKSMIDKVLANIRSRQFQLAKVQNQITSGNLIEKTSDDPGAANQIMELSSHLRQLNQLKRNVNNGLSQLSLTDSALANVREVLISARATTVQGANDAVSEENRMSLSTALDEAVRSLVSIANQKSGNRWLFGGFSNASPFKLNFREDGKIDNVEEIHPEIREVQVMIGGGELMTVGYSANNVFGMEDGGTIFSVLLQIRDALEADDAIEVGNLLDRLDEGMEQMSNLSTMVGSKYTFAENLNSNLDEMTNYRTKLKSELADVDLVSIVTRYQEEQVAYELSLKSAGRIIQSTLINFLGS